LFGLQDADLGVVVEIPDQFLWVLLELRERVEVVWNDDAGMQESDRVSSVGWPHGVGAADRQDCDVEAFVPDQSHVTEQCGVAPW
jgi:hypothetical protein